MVCYFSCYVYRSTTRYQKIVICQFKAQITTKQLSKWKIIIHNIKDYNISEAVSINTKYQISINLGVLLTCYLNDCKPIYCVFKINTSHSGNKQPYRQRTAVNYNARWRQWAQIVLSKCWLLILIGFSSGSLYLFVHG